MQSDSGRAAHVTVGPEDAGQRIDNFLLRHLKGVPRSHVYRLLRTGQVRVNKGRIKAQYRVEEGDVVRLPPVRTAAAAPSPAPGQDLVRKLDEWIVYEDADLLVIDKPAGLAVHGGSGVSYGLIEALRAARPDARFLELVHRLDRDTSGCVMIAKRRSMLRALHELMREGGIRKHYLALVVGEWQGGARKVQVALRKDLLKGGERHVKVDEDEGKRAISHFKPLQRFPDATLMEIGIVTGRTHQIRVHAAHLGHPVAGDDKYGDRDANRRLREQGLKRMFLHAASLGFERPGTGEPLAISAPLEPALRALLDTLEQADG